jgi:hypothetical protein
MTRPRHSPGQPAATYACSSEVTFASIAVCVSDQVFVVSYATPGAYEQHRTAAVLARDVPGPGGLHRRRQQPSACNTCFRANINHDTERLMVDSTLRPHLGRDFDRA